MDTSAKDTKKKGTLSYFTDALRKYAVFKGRARRTEFFCFSIIANAFIISFDKIFNLFGEESLLSYIGLIPSLALIVPILAVGWRRMHDSGKNGFYYLIPIYNIILMFKAGDTGENKYGPDPKANE
jgi:uncharacterized membrane protein YhaH (DUF805 family)